MTLVGVLGRQGTLASLVWGPHTALSTPGDAMARQRRSHQKALQDASGQVIAIANNAAQALSLSTPSCFE